MSAGRRDYATRKAARIARLERRAASLRAEGAARIAQADRIASFIPLGQPVLIGHHSERRHRRDLQRIRDGHSKGFAALKEADDTKRRAAAAAESVAISSDDPDAIARLREKLAEAERQRDRLLEANKLLRKGASLEEAGKLLDWWKDPAGRLAIWRSMGHRTVPTGNLGAEIRRIKGRIAELEARAAAPEREPEQIGAVRVLEDENRVQIHFPGKPPEPIRRELKSHGFRFAPTMGAWVRMASEGAWYYARRIAAQAGGTP